MTPSAASELAIAGVRLTVPFNVRATGSSTTSATTRPFVGESRLTFTVRVTKPGLLTVTDGSPATNRGAVPGEVNVPSVPVDVVNEPRTDSWYGALSSTM